ncbi:MAG TPA: hypothetical protein VJT13_15195 [Xanthobacteraceae bacterium]|nr:hypothetical protein [Xanthobacteraceae bacterium]
MKRFMCCSFLPFSLLLATRKCGDRREENDFTRSPFRAHDMGVIRNIRSGRKQKARLAPGLRFASLRDDQ